jgi:broad specificity phosphatase PhoE
MNCNGSTHFYLIRHGQTDSNKLGILHGLTDWPLNPTGRDQVERLAECVAESIEMDFIYSSPLRRARATAEAIALISGKEIKFHQSFSEMNFGEAEGAYIREIGQLYPEESQGFVDAFDLDIRFPGGESRREFFQRVEFALNELRYSHPRQQIAIVAHGGVIAAIMRLLHQDENLISEHAHIENCSITHIEVDAEKTLTHRYNDIRHLELE